MELGLRVESASWMRSRVESGIMDEVKGGECIMDEVKGGGVQTLFVVAGRASAGSHHSTSAHTTHTPPSTPPAESSYRRAWEDKTRSTCIIPFL